MKLDCRGLTLLLMQPSPFISKSQEMEEEHDHLREGSASYQQAEILE